MAVKFEQIRKTKTGAYYHVTGASISLLNALRRIVNSSLPTFAIDEVTFFENSSALFNEYIAHRLALIPLTLDQTAAPDLQVSFSLEATGPTVVYSKDLKSTDEKIAPASQRIPIIVLNENQSIRLEATATMGIARQHAKFQNSHASYSHYPNLKIKGSKTEALKVLPKGTVDENGKVLHPENLDIDILSDNVSITPVEGEYILYIESYSGEAPEHVLNRAVSILKQKTDELKTELK